MHGQESEGGGDIRQGTSWEPVNLSPLWNASLSFKGLHFHFDLEMWVLIVWMVQGRLPQRLESYILRQLGHQTAFGGTGSFDMKMAMSAEPAESFYSICLVVAPVFSA